MLSDIQSALRKSIERDAQRVGDFLIHFDTHDDHPFRNYAIPDDGAQPSPAAVSELVAAFVGRDRTPRLEYVAPALAVESALTAAGFAVDARLPLMTVTRDRFRRPATPEGVELGVATADGDLHAVARVQNIAYGVGEAVTAADVDRLRATNDGGGKVVLARYRGEPAGAGLFTPARDGLAQLGAGAVLPGYQRRGVASAVGAELTALAFAAGATPYLETESRNESWVCGRMGYSTIGEMIAISLAQQG